MIDVVLFGAAAAALLVGVISLARAVTQPVFHGPWLHGCATSDLLQVSAEQVRSPDLAAALRDRAAQLSAHGD